MGCNTLGGSILASSSTLTMLDGRSGGGGSFADKGAARQAKCRQASSDEGLKGLLPRGICPIANQRGAQIGSLFALF
jgi:hypothetical protein